MLRYWWYHSNCPCSNSISPQFHISEEERLWQKASSLSRAGQAISCGNGYLTSNLNSINEMLLRADSLSCFYTADANRFFPMCVSVREIFSGQCSRLCNANSRARINPENHRQWDLCHCQTVRRLHLYLYTVNLETKKKVPYNYIVII